MKLHAADVPWNDQSGATTLPLRLKIFRFVGKRTWIPRGQDRILRVLWPPDGKCAFPFEVDCLGMRYPGDLSDLVDWYVFAYGSCARRELDLLAELAAELRNRKDTITFFDIGANCGNHSLFMSQHADQVIAFEPFPALQKRITQKIEINRRTNIHVIPYALGDKDGAFPYYPGEGGNSGSGTFIPESSGAYNSPVDLEIRCGDRLCAELGLPRIDILKVDVEGFEPNVFHGLAERIHRDRPPILTELGDQSKQGFGSEQVLRDALYEGAMMAEVAGRNGCTFRLKPFRYEKTFEALIVPPELAGWVAQRMDR
jgi:FkbM family methyltransferase